MARELKSKQIGDILYECFPFMPTKALEYQLELLKIIGKPLGALYGKADIKMDGNENAVEDIKESKFDIKAAVSMLADSIKPTFHTKFIKGMLSEIRIDNMAINFDNHFQTKIMDIYKVLLFAIETNYPDFFSMIDIGAVMKQASGIKEQSEEHSEELRGVV